MIKVASIQFQLDDNENKETRIKKVENYIDRCSRSDLIILPELWNIGFLCFDKYKKRAETLSGETITRIADKAKEVDAYILAGTIVEKSGNDLYNTAVFINPDGDVIAKYRKMHLVKREGSREDALITRGEDVVSIETELGIFGFAICRDLRHPELFRRMAVKHGVEIFLLSASWPLVRVENWTELSHARANENQAYLISSNNVGYNKGQRLLGHSSIVDPHGMSIASSGIFETIVRGEIDVKKVRKFRKETPHLENIQLSV